MFSIIYDFSNDKRTLREVLGELDLKKIAKEAEKRPVILRGFFNKNQTQAIKNQILSDFPDSSISQNFKYYEGCPNVNKYIYRDYSYFRPERRFLWNYFLWNQDDKNPIFQIGKTFIELLNLLTGFPKDYGHDPKCGHFYTLSTMCYPKGGGFLGPHVDDYGANYQALLIMSKLGVDYKEGGVYCFDEENKCRYLEPELEYGDVLLLPATVVHGVYAVDPKENDELYEGRWAFFTPMPRSDSLVNSPNKL